MTSVLVLLGVFLMGTAPLLSDTRLMVIGLLLFIVGAGSKAVLALGAANQDRDVARARPTTWTELYCAVCHTPRPAEDCAWINNEPTCKGCLRVMTAQIKRNSNEAA